MSPREALLTLGFALLLPLEIDDDGSEYLRSSADTTLDIHLDDIGSGYPLVLTVWHWKGQADAQIALREMQPLIARSTGWTLIASD